MSVLRARVIVWPMESGPAGPGRPVEIDGREAGIAQDWADVDRIVAAAGLDPSTPVVWRGGGPNVWA